MYFQIKFSTSYISSLSVEKYLQIIQKSIERISKLLYRNVIVEQQSVITLASILFRAPLPNTICRLLNIMAKMKGVCPL